MGDGLDMDKLAAAVAQRLGPGWSAGEGPWGSGDAKLTGPGGAVLHIQLATAHRPPRVAVGGMFDRELRDHIRSEERSLDGDITVAADSSPQRIADHIHRRLLPNYLMLLDRVTQRRDAANAVDRDKSAVMDQLAGLLPPDGRQHRTGHWVDFSGANGLKGHATTCYPWPRVRFEVDLSVPDAVALAQWLSDRSTGKGDAG